MRDENESISNIIIGEHPKVFITCLMNDKTEFRQIGLQASILKSLDEYERKYADTCQPFHVFLNEAECGIFVLGLAQIDPVTTKRDMYKSLALYEHVLREQNISLAAELRIAGRLATDQEATDYLRKLNIRLRKHMENIHQHYANPVQLPGDRGRIRAAKVIPQVIVRWP
jgi:hypothetical protein